jgi:hypothetical protein
MMRFLSAMRWDRDKSRDDFSERKAVMRHSRRWSAKIADTPPVRRSRECEDQISSAWLITKELIVALIVPTCRITDCEGVEGFEANMEMRMM